MIFSSKQICEAAVRQSRYQFLCEEVAKGDSQRTFTRYKQEGGELATLPRIHVDSFNPERCGPNSYDLTLADTLLVYNRRTISAVNPISGASYDTEAPLDMRQDNPTTAMTIPPGGLVLEPGTLYLGATAEYTETFNCVPWIDGRSSIGRLGCAIHVTAGRGDVGFCGRFTLEIFVIHPLRIYAGARIAQMTYFATGEGGKQYAGRYNNRPHSLPVASRLWQDSANKPEEAP